MIKAAWTFLSGLGIGFYVKLGIAIAVVAVLVGGTWYFRGLKAEHDQTVAVNDATQEVRKELAQEQATRQVYQTLAEGKLAAILTGVSNIKTVHQTVTNNITKEVQSNPAFYNQKLPDVGYAQWIAARNLINQAAAGSPASAGLPASAPVSSSQSQ